MSTTPAVPERRHLPSRNHRRKPKLPVVNVIPFLSEREHTWCKHRSLPEFYEKPDVMLSGTEACMKPPPTALSAYSDSSLILHENRPILPLAQSNRPNIYDEMSSRRSHISLDEGSVVSGGEMKGRRIVFPATPRTECISPDNAIKNLPKYGFAPTIVDREKKTAKESPRIKPTSLLLRERTEEFTTSHQVMKLKGRRMMGARIQQSGGVHFQKTVSLPMRNLDDFYRQLLHSYNRGYAFSPTKSRLSHPQTNSLNQGQSLLPSRKSTDPLLSVNHESMSERLNKHTDISESKSAFRLLNTAGKPTPVEQNLARDYNIVLDNTKSLGTPSTNITGQHFTRHLKLKNYNPTQGELFLMMNRESNRPGNRSKDSRNGERGRVSADLNENWSYLDSDEPDIHVSPEMPVISESPNKELDNNQINVPGCSISTNPVTDHDSASRKLNTVDQSDDETESRDQSESKVEERIEIKTVLPVINCDNIVPP